MQLHYSGLATPSAELVPLPDDAAVSRHVLSLVPAWSGLAPALRWPMLCASKVRLLGLGSSRGSSPVKRLSNRRILASPLLVAELIRSMISTWSAIRP